MKRFGPALVSASVAMASLVTLNGSAAASGYAVLEQSVKGIGTAYAGCAAAGDDPSTVFYNPAGLTRLAGSQAVAGAHLVVPSVRFRNEGSTDLTGQPLLGGQGGNAGTLLKVPNLYASHQLNERLYLGLGVFAPFGLSTEYDRDWVGRYHGIKSELVSVNLNPALAWAVTDKLSIGAGFSAQYIKAELSNAIDFGSIFASLDAPGFAPQQNDGFVTFEGDSWSWGYNAGLLYQFTQGTRGGVAYRSEISHTLRGSADFSGVPAFNPTGRFADSDIQADATTPDTLSVSLWHDFTGRFAAMADATWTNWSKLSELRIRFDNPAESDAVTSFRWKDTMRYSLGAVYAPGAWAFRAGAAYDESPVPEERYRTPRLPDNDRIWIAAGVGYRASQSVSLQAGYAHLFVRQAHTGKTAEGEDLFRGALNGSYRSNIDIVSAEVYWRF